MSEKISLDSSELRIENWFSKYSLIFNSQFSIVQCVYNFFRSKIVARLYFMAKRM